MSAYQVALDYRLKQAWGVTQFIALARWLMDEIGFDEGARYDLAWERPGEERTTQETTAAGLAQLLLPSVWPALHQLVLVNHWIKGLNFKLHLVQREGEGALSIKFDIADAAARERLVRRLNERLASQCQDTPGFAGPSNAERDRLFGSLLVNERVATAARTPFLAGDFYGSLQAAMRVLEDRLHQLTPGAEGKGLKAAALRLCREPACLLLPDRSGQRLRQELEGLSHLALAISQLSEPLLRGQSRALDPAPVLKRLVLISLLLEQLENASVNTRIQRKVRSKARAKTKAKKTTRPSRRTQGRSVKRTARRSKR